MRARENTWRYASVVIAGMVLLAAVLGGTAGASNVNGYPSGRRLTELVPEGAGGWRSEDLPVGETEQLITKVERVLRYDDVLYRKYTGAGGEFSIYIAYWRPGSITPREVTFHTPDRCWIHAGWIRASSETNYYIKTNAGSFGPVQERVFETQNLMRQNVAFWHLVDGKTVVYSALDAADDLSMVRDLLRYGIAMKREQYFIRISSGRPLSELSADPFFSKVLTSLAHLGRAASEKGRADGLN